MVIGISPILDVPGVELIGWLPPELQSYIVFTASIGSLAKQVDGARARDRARVRRLRSVFSARL